MNGYAILTNATQSFLDRCEAVKSCWLLSVEVVGFFFDPAVEVNGPIPAGVYFGLDQCTNGDHERKIRAAIRMEDERRSE